MKIKFMLLTLFVSALVSTGVAQKTKPTAAAGPDQVVKNLYAAQKSEKTNPFAQIKSRALVDKYFVKDLADMIWQTNSSDTGWNVDPLYNAQDTQITGFTVGKPADDGTDKVYLKVKFNNFGKATWIGFGLMREANKTWKVDNIYYVDGEDLASMLRYSTDKEYQKDYDDDKTFKGDYKVGTMACDVAPTMSRLFYRVTCEGQEFKLYTAEGTEQETVYSLKDEKGKPGGRFVFKVGEENGKYFDAAGKESKVTRVQ